MMADRNGLQPIIIKKKRVVAGDGHHGGAWKVAIVILLDDLALLQPFHDLTASVSFSSF